VEAAEALGPERPAVAGHSLGGAVAITAALEHPELFSRLLLIGTGARLRVVPAVIEALKTDFDEVMRNMRQFSFGPGASPEAIKTAEDMMRRNGRETMLEDFLACDAFDAMARLGEIRIPALAVCGEADMLTPPKYSRFLAERAPNCRLVTIPEAGHMVMLEAPAALAEIIGEFIG
jgi:pimeloyl-ACP methyl ester carboxylesterase